MEKTISLSRECFWQRNVSSNSLNQEIEMIGKVIKTILFIAFCGTSIYSQDIKEASYNLEFLKAKEISDEMFLMFKYSTQKPKDFKLIISERFFYKFSNEEEYVSGSLRKDGNSMVVFGKDMESKDSKLYNLIKDLVDFKSENEFLIIVFKLNNISKKDFDKMVFKYGLWEPSNTNIRFEKEYYISIN